MREKSAILLLGGNQGKVSVVLASALALIEKEVGRITAISNTYSTKAWGPVAQADFLNLAVRVKTILPPKMMLHRLLDIEKKFGRKREVKYGPRTLDIDILFYSSLIIKGSGLTIPHPEIQNRRFALQPCTDFMPNFVHPQLKKSIRVLLQECQDELEVKLWKQ